VSDLTDRFVSERVSEWVGGRLTARHGHTHIDTVTCGACAFIRDGYATPFVPACIHAMAAMAYNI